MKKYIIYIKKHEFRFPWITFPYYIRYTFQAKKRHLLQKKQKSREELCQIIST